MEHQRNLGETDFLTSYRPENGEVDKATRKFIERLDKRVNSPINKYRGFTKANSKPTDSEIWRTIANQNFELFRSKFSYELEEYCKENGFAKETANGVLISDDIGEEYMSILADEIANNNNMHVITDLKDNIVRNKVLRNPLGNYRELE
ncbi:hypothetical protein ACIQ2D_20740 [Lysinibacillus sp. NPDC097287]|uniref:hypothetical protein n=1 Tax=Lysinibacillus sp. NPDC097287 TaxID=3364144 RepID=UPI0037FBC8C2